MALIPPPYLNGVVSIEMEAEKTKDDGTKYLEMQPIATGFLYGRFVSREKENKLYKLYLVTNRHVFQDMNSGEYLKKVHLRFNLVEKKGTKDFVVDLVDNKGKPIWLSHSNKKVDLAVLPIIGNELAANSIDFYFFRDDKDVFLARDFEKLGVATGDAIFVLGFPLGIRGNSRNFAIVKAGVIARYDEELLTEHYFFVDSNTYPGNSGGPVIFKPEVVSIQGTNSINQAGIIGVISAGISYQEVAVSSQTNRPRIIFEEQTGIVKVVPMDSVNETIDQYIKEKGEPEVVEEIKDEK